MTGRDILEKRVRRIRQCMAIGFGLYFIPILAAYFFPWLALLVPIGVIICVVALVVSLRSLRCPECGGLLGNLLMIKQAGQLFALPSDLIACPHCEIDLTGHRSYEDLLEVLSAYDRGDDYHGVISAPVGGERHQYETRLDGGARKSFADILNLRPFGKHGGPYRYFILPPASDHNTSAPNTTCNSPNDAAASTRPYSANPNSPTAPITLNVRPSILGSFTENSPAV